MPTETPHRTPALTASRPAPAKAVLVHGGARDSYQLALALSQAGLLQTLVTDLFWPADRAWARALRKLLPSRFLSLAVRRGASSLPASQVTQRALDGLRGLLLDRLPGIPFALRRRSTRLADAALGAAAGALARQSGAGLVAYSYYAYDAIRSYGGPAMLFQLHPHPATMRSILNTELALHPECAASLGQEWELALPEEDYQHLVAEPLLAAHLLVASSFTRQSLEANGVPAERITVIPYGVDLQRFHVSTRLAPVRGSRLELLFVGRINQRKGVSYLLEALRSFPSDQVHLTVCGRVVDDLKLFAEFGAQVTIRPSVSASELVAAYQAADLFVFPSVAEGFGQVLLESLACGLPILSTTHTAAPDLIQEGVEGFIVEPRRADLLVQRIEWALSHREELFTMRALARRRAEHFTWARFRETAAQVIAAYLQLQQP